MHRKSVVLVSGNRCSKMICCLHTIEAQTLSLKPCYTKEIAF